MAVASRARATEPASIASDLRRVSPWIFAANRRAAAEAAVEPGVSLRKAVKDAVAAFVAARARQAASTTAEEKL